MFKLHINKKMNKAITYLNLNKQKKKANKKKLDCIKKLKKTFQDF